MSTRAIQDPMQLLGFRDPVTDDVLAGGSVEFYGAGGSVAKNAWEDKDKASAITSVTLDSAGQAQVYLDGVYKFIVKNAAGTTKYTLDNLKFQARNTSTSTKTADYQCTADDDYILVNTDGGAVTITLAAVAGVVAPITIKNIGSSGNTVTVDGSGAETIDGSLTATLADNTSQQYVTDGVQWYGAGVATGTTFTSTSLIFGSGLSEVTVGDETTISVDGIVEQGSSAEIKMKVIDIGDWDMDAVASVSIAHGIAGADITKIRPPIGATINNDTGTEVRNLESPDPASPATDTTLQGNVVYVSETNVILSRLTGGIYDSADYNSIINPVGGSRGRITIWYVT